MKKILLAYDGGEPARRALETAGELARAFHAPVSVVGVVPHGPDGPAADSLIDASARAHGLQEAKRLLAAMGIEVEVLEPSGDPACRIEQIAEEGGFDTIVIGSGDGTPIGHAFRGSTSRHVVAHAAATVVVAH